MMRRRQALGLMGAAALGLAMSPAETAAVEVIVGTEVIPEGSRYVPLARHPQLSPEVKDVESGQWIAFRTTWVWLDYALAEVTYVSEPDVSADVISIKNVSLAFAVEE